MPHPSYPTRTEGRGGFRPQVLAEGLPLLEELNGVPARKPTASSIVYGAAAKAGGDVRSRIEQEYRPLLKVQVAACTVR